MDIVRSATFHTQGVVLTLGNFDGVHRGHQALLSEVKKQAVALQAQAMALTFYPPPKVYFLKEQYSFIHTFADKCRLMHAAGIDEILFLRFNQAMAELSAERFFEKYILPLNIKALILGDDFHFGKKRAGNAALLAQYGQKHGFGVTQLQTQNSESVRISSSRIRHLLMQGELAAAHALLGHAPVVTGHVIHGAKRGRHFGFPTLNLKVNDPLCFAGIFAVKVLGLFDEPVEGVASLGPRPMYDKDDTQLLEVFVFDKKLDAYGKKVSVQFFKKIRDMKHFESEAQLIHAMQDDLHQAKLFFGMV